MQFHDTMNSDVVKKFLKTETGNVWISICVKLAGNFISGSKKCKKLFSVKDGGSSSFEHVSRFLHQTCR